MKKISNYLKIAAIIAFIAFIPEQQEKKYHLEFTESQMNALIYVVDNSTAPHTAVKQIELLIQTQLNAQNKPDSAGKKK